MRIVKQADVTIREIILALKRGETVVYPTETCYGLGCDSTNESAVKKVFAIKKRPLEKSVLVLMADIDMAKSYVVWNNTIYELAKKYWPGPLTIVVPACERGEVLPPGVMGQDGLIAFRISSHPLAFAICRALGRPLVSTSANLAAEPEPYNIDNVVKMFEQETAQPDIVIDAGELTHRPPTTIVRIIEDKMEVVRRGELLISNY